MKNLFTIFFLLGVIILLGCNKFSLCKDDKITLQKTNPIGNVLRTDGYFWGEINKQSTKPVAHIYYLYQNGTFFAMNTSDLSKIDQGEIIGDVENAHGKKSKSKWGTFFIGNNTIEIERWQYAIDGCETTIYEKGPILNDTSFLITHREYREERKCILTEHPNSLFIFKAIPQKPDSINPYIK